MDSIVEALVDQPIPFALAAVIAVFVIIGLGKALKGIVKIVTVLLLLACIAGVVAWMGAGGPLP